MGIRNNVEITMDKRKRKISKNMFSTLHSLPSKRKEHSSVFTNVDPDDTQLNTDGIESRSDESASDCEEEYEKKPRIQKSVNVRNLLPIKHKDGFVHRTEIVKEETDEEPIAEQKTEPQSERKLSLVEKYAIQKNVLDGLKRKVALLCTSIVEDPENNIIAMKELIAMLVNTSTQMIVTEKKILCVSLLHVFSDILPGYKIRIQEEKDSKVKLKKETKKLLSYEQNLLRYYIKFVDYLCKLVQDMKMKTKQVNKFSETKRKAVYEIGLTAVKCLCELLCTKFSFNHFKNISNMVVPLVVEDNEKVSNICCQSFEKMFKADKLGEASLYLVRQIVNFIKERKFQVPACLLRSFQSLNLKEAKPEENKIDMSKGRKEWHNMSRKERRNKKKMKELEAELKEAQAQESVDNVQKFHMQTLNKMFWVFFHILKDGKKIALLAPALEGLSKFAYLINLEFFDDLNTVLCGLMESGKLSDVDKLHSVYTLFTILAGQAESLHIDPYKIYCHMYQGLLKLSHSTDVEHYILILKCLEFNILRKRRKISFTRILAFTKRVSTISLQTPVHATLALLCAVRSILSNVKGSDILLDTESTVGSGIYYPEMEDPEHCNAQSTTLWEFHILKKHYCPFIRLYSQYILHGCPNQGRLSLPQALEKSSPEDTLNLFSDVAVLNKMDFLEESEEPPKKKIRSSTDIDEFIYEKDLEFDLNWKVLKEIDFFRSEQSL